MIPIVKSFAENSDFVKSEKEENILVIWCSSVIIPWTSIRNITIVICTYIHKFYTQSQWSDRMWFTIFCHVRCHVRPRHYLSTAKQHNQHDTKQLIWRKSFESTRFTVISDFDIISEGHIHPWYHEQWRSIWRSLISHYLSKDFRSDRRQISVVTRQLEIFDRRKKRMLIMIELQSQQKNVFCQIANDVSDVKNDPIREQGHHRSFFQIQIALSRELSPSDRPLSSRVWKLTSSVFCSIVVFEAHFLPMRPSLDRGHHLAACARTRVQGHRGFPLESAAVWICREVRELSVNVCVTELDLLHRGCGGWVAALPRATIRRRTVQSSPIHGTAVRVWWGLDAKPGKDDLRRLESADASEGRCHWSILLACGIVWSSGLPFGTSRMWGGRWHTLSHHLRPEHRDCIVCVTSDLNRLWLFVLSSSHKRGRVLGSLRRGADRLPLPQGGISLPSQRKGLPPEEELLFPKRSYPFPQRSFLSGTAALSENTCHDPNVLDGVAHLVNRPETELTALCLSLGGPETRDICHDDAERDVTTRKDVTTHRIWEN